MADALKVVVHRDPEVFDYLSDWWNQCPGPQVNPFLRSEWFAIWVKHFLPRSAHLEVVTWTRAGEPVAALPLWRKGVRRASLSNSHTEVFDVIGDIEGEDLQQVHDWLRRQPTTSFVALQGDTAFAGGLSTFDGQDARRIDAPFVELTEGPSAVWGRLSRNLRKSLQRRERRMSELGEVVFVENADGEIPNVLIACLELEAAGWKGREGTAVLNRVETLRFYTQLAETARAEGWLRLSALLVSERPVSFEFDLQYAGRRFSLKSGYDERLAPLSPGQILTWKVIEAAAASGAISYEFGGEAEPWKTQWTALSRPRLNMRLYASLGAQRALRPALRVAASGSQIIRRGLSRSRGNGASGGRTP